MNYQTIRNELLGQYSVADPEIVKGGSKSSEKF